MSTSHATTPSASKRKKRVYENLYSRLRKQYNLSNETSLGGGGRVSAIQHLNQMELAIVQYLFDHVHEYQSSKVLASQIAVSDKTIRKYIRELEEVLAAYGASIEMKKGSGYRLQIADNQLFYQLIEAIREQKYAVEDVGTIVDNQNRERFILNAILLENRLVTIDDFSEVLFISKSTVSTVIQIIKNRIRKFGLEIHYDIDGHVRIEGLEIEKRRFILAYFFAPKSVDTLNTDLLDYKFEGFSTETIFIIVLEKCREFDVRLSDYVLQNLVLHIALAIKRNEKGFVINKVFDEAAIEYSKELFVAEKIVASIEALIAIKFPEDEAKYIALHLKSKANQTMSEMEQTLVHADPLEAQLTAALLKMQAQPQTTGLNFMLDQQLLMGLKLHFDPLLTRLKTGISLKNPLFEEITSKYTDVFAATQAGLTDLPFLAGYQISQHEWAYIALHLLAAVERFKQDHKVNAIVICATGLGSAQMLKNRLENEFSANLKIVDVISYYQLKDDMLTDIDLIISTIDISTSFYNIPVVKVSVFLNKQDIDALNLHIQRHDYKIENKKDLPTSEENQQLEQIFNRYLKPERFLVYRPGAKTPHREDLLEQQIIRLTDFAHSPNFQQDLLNQIEIRERFGSLAFTEHVAFPHPAQPVGITGEIVVGLVPDGLVWDSEHPDVKIVVLMSHSKFENKGLDVINSGLAELIKHQEKVEAILQKPTFENFKQIFMEIVRD